MAALNPTTFAYALKTLYSKEKLENMVYKNNPWFAMCPKDQNFGGANFVEAVLYGHLAGRSATFSDAQDNKAASKGVAFTITRVKDYALASIDSETILASRGNERAFIEAVKREMDSAIHALTRSMAKAMYGDGSGRLCVVSAVSGGVITPTNLDDVTNFEVGMKIEAIETADGGERVGTGTVTLVNRDSGLITYSGSIASIAATDYIVAEGDQVTAGTYLMMRGLAAWVPSTAPVLSSDSFFGVDRGADPSRLGGIRIDGTALAIDEALIKLCSRIAREGGSPDCIFLSHEKCEELNNLLGSKVYYKEHMVGQVGFKGFEVMMPHGSVTVFPDQNCPSNRGYALTKDTWKLRSLGPAPRILDLDGLKWQREASADAYEIRVAFFGNLSCRGPGWNGVVLL